MATIVGAPYRLSYEDVMRMVETGVLSERTRVELVQGVLIGMVPPSEEHSSAVAWLGEHFARAGHRGWQVRVQDLLKVPGGFDMPDVMLIERVPRDQHPDTALLVVEVTKTTHERDRRKIAEYAAAGVDEYWIVDLPARKVVVHREPRGGEYEQLSTYRDGDVIEPLAPGAPAVAVSELLG